MSKNKIIYNKITFICQGCKISKVKKILQPILQPLIIVIKTIIYFFKKKSLYKKKVVKYFFQKSKF